MRMDPEELAAAERAIIELDFSEENERLVEINRKIAEAKAAQDEGRRRVAALNGDRQTADVMAASQVADALLSGDDRIDAETILKSHEALQAEKEGLIAGMRELSSRISRLEAERSQVREEARMKVRAAAQPLADMVLDQARHTAEELVRSFGALRTISVVAGLYPNELASAHQAVRALMLDNGLIVSRSRSVDVPADVVEALSPLENAGAVLPVGKYGISRTVEW